MEKIKLKIKIIKPYIFKKINNMDEFVNTQKILFKDGYTWINGTDIYDDETFMNFPIYLSNIEFENAGENKYKDKFLSVRRSFNIFTNNVLFFTDDLNKFDKKLLRKIKLKKINKNNGKITF